MIALVLSVLAHCRTNALNAVKILSVMERDHVYVIFQMDGLLLTHQVLQSALNAT